MPFIGLYSDGNMAEWHQGDLALFSVAMVCPWMPNGTIRKYLEVNKSAKILDNFLLEIAQGLFYLHSQSVVHGDLRGGNILVDEEGHARLADFGLAVWVDATTKDSSTRAGSTRWMAPELLHPESLQLTKFRRTLATDVYAFACVCYELYHEDLQPPFAELHDGAVMFNVTAGQRPCRLSVIPAETWLIIQACWAQEPQTRLRTAEIVDKLEVVRMARLADGNGASPSPAESSRVYKPPRPLGISQTKNGGLARPASLIINISSPVFCTQSNRLAPAHTQTQDRPTRLRRHSSFLELFCGLSRTEEYQSNWRQRRRAVSEFFQKAILRQ
ncbi:Protein kinase domain-containing protein [Mycena sanguinolenta]|uniref:Protein kinase domain-containing protein n=1 Tax=Mycena sanguinolenta TaxID=230812 RepID=A0A8H6ZF42_9AGAR|nr:Protein kinase domain-containing protein [Mycena sanguinolenta]